VGTVLTDWQLLRTAAENVASRPAPGGNAGVRHRWTYHWDRIRLSVAGRTGTAGAFHDGSGADLAALLYSAARRASAPPVRREPSRPAPAGTGPPAGNEPPALPEIQRLSWQAGIGRERHIAGYALYRPDRPPLRWQVRRTLLLLGIDQAVCARAEPDTALLPAEAPEPGRWPLLLSPLLLSALLLAPTLNRLGAAASWPAVSLGDPAAGGGFDDVGEPRRPLWFVDNGTVVGGPGGETTDGFGVGLHDLLVVGPDHGNDPPLPSAGAFVSSGTVCGDPEGPRLVVLHERADAAGRRRTHGCPVGDVRELLGRGTWCGPFQRGAGPWISRWLALDQEDVS
jgi:hypothetical protein